MIKYKFVIMNRTDYDWAKDKLFEHQLHNLVGTVWFSPMFNVASDINEDVGSEVPVLARELAEWMLARCPTRSFSIAITQNHLGGCQRQVVPALTSAHKIKRIKPKDEGVQYSLYQNMLEG